jgi:hypothetical protein
VVECALVKGGVLVQHHDPAKSDAGISSHAEHRNRRPLDRLSDQPGTGDGNQIDCGAFGTVAFLPQIRRRSEDWRFP